MKQTAVTIAVMGFFVLAGVGWFAGLSPLDCGIKAMVGAIALYIVSTIAGRMVVSVMVQTIISVNAEKRRNVTDEDISGEPAK